MRFLTCLALLLIGYVNARVTFSHSEVLQAPDIAGTNKANFNCKNQCKVYVDRKYNLLMITQKDNTIANFNAIVGADAFVPIGFVLPAGDYALENRGEVNPEFVMYIVDTTSPNYGAPVFAPQEKFGIAMAFPNRYATILSSFEAMWWSGFNGTFPAGYPRVYATGFDAVDVNCHPVYQARSQYNSEVSWPTIGTAVQTVDFGFVGLHNASVNYRKLNDMTRGQGSTVYTSPGYVGCSYINGQNYYSPITQVNDAFKVDADSLDIEASYTGITAGETIHFSVNKDTLDMVGSSGQTLFGKHYDKGTFDVELSWARQTPSSSFALQLDFGSVNDDGLQTTTKMGPSLSCLTAVALVIAGCLRV